MAKRLFSISLLLFLSVLILWENFAKKSAVYEQEEFARALSDLCSTNGRLMKLPYKDKGNVGSKPKPTKLLRDLGRQAFESLQSKRTPQNLHRMALIKIVDGRLSEATELLFEAVEMEPEDPAVLNDLGVALMERGSERNEAYDLIVSLFYIDRSLYLAKSHEALFNKGLVLERLSLRNQSRLAWSHYLSVDHNSPWGKKVQEHLAQHKDYRSSLAKLALERELDSALQRRDVLEIRALVRQYPQDVRLYAEDDLFLAWAQALVSGNTLRADELGLSLTTLGKELFKAEGDPLIMEAALLLQERSGPCLQKLAQGYLAYAQGRLKYRGRYYSGARRLFKEAESRLSACGSSFQYWAAFQSLACEYYMQDYDVALESAAHLYNELQDKPYFGLLGRIAWARGLICLEVGDAGRSIVYFRDSLGKFVKNREIGNQASLCSLLANAFFYLGDLGRSWDYRIRGLYLAAEAGDRQRLPVILGEAARAVSRDGKPSIAIYFQSEALAFDLESKDALKISEALWRRSMIWQEDGRLANASDDLAAAMSYFEEIPKEGDRYTHLFAGMLLTKGMILRHTAPFWALEYLNKAQGLFQNSGYSYSLVDVYLEKSKVHRALGNLHESNNDLLAAVREFERQEDRINYDDALKISYFAQAQKIFDELIEIKASQNDALGAFEVSERSKARGLIRALGVDSPQERLERAESSDTLKWNPSGVEDILESLPDKTTVLAYSVLDDESLVWVIRRSEFRMYHIPKKRKDVQRLVDKFSTDLQANKPATPRWRATSGDLFDIFVRPFSAEFGAGDSLVIVPDKELRRVSFSALIDRFRNRFLIEDYSIVVAPSTVFSVRLARLKSDSHLIKPTALVVGDPYFKKENYPFLPTLPASRKEASRIVDLFPGSEILVGSDATVRQLFTGLRRHQIIHLAAHYLVDPHVPSMSRVLLTPSSRRDSGEVRSLDIAGLRLHNTRLAVLAGCSSAIGRLVDLEGAGDLGHSFLIAGVERVIVSLWNLGDKDSEIFWQKFYGNLRNLGSAELALQAAQVDMIKHGARPATWAGYQLIGSI